MKIGSLHEIFFIGVLGSQREGHDWATEMNWTDRNWTELNNNFIRINRLSTDNFGKSSQIEVECSSTYFSSVQFSAVAQSCPTLCDPMNCSTPASLSITNSRSSLRLTSIKSVMPSSYLILGRPHFLLSPIPPRIRVFSNESTLHMRWPKYWKFSFSIIPSKEIAGLISFRMDWLDLLSIQGTLKSLLQHQSSNHQFFSAQLSPQSNSHIHTWPWEKP